MRILQLTSDWKWTGPAEPMLLLLRGLRASGHEVELACPEPPDAEERSLAAMAQRAGVEPVLGLERARGLRWARDRADARKLGALVRERDIDVVHAWHTRAHGLAWRALGERRATGRSVLVRSHASAAALAPWPWNRWLYGPGCDGLWCVSPAAARRNEGLRGGRPIAGSLGAAAPERFERASGVALRRALDLAPDAPVIGVVARVQPHRRFDLLFAAMARLAGSHPDARLLVLGRGTAFERVARRPVAQLGLADRVVLAGYRSDDYAEALAAMDCLTYLVPGSDGTCRALLEAAAAGVPAVASRRGALPEIVLDGETGLLVDETPESLARAWGRLLDDPSLRRKLGAAARARAESQFTPAAVARAAEGLYRDALGARRGGAAL